MALNGAGQTGKSTLARVSEGSAHPAIYLTMDDADVLDAASSDASAFIAGLDGPVVLNEVQRVLGLLLAIKAAVDRDRLPGRIEILTLWPFSVAFCCRQRHPPAAGQLAGLHADRAGSRSPARPRCRRVGRLSGSTAPATCAGASRNERTRPAALHSAGRSRSVL